MYIASSLTSGCWWSDSTSDSKKDGEGDARPGQTCVNILPCLYFGWVRPPLLSGIWVINMGIAWNYMWLEELTNSTSYAFGVCICLLCLSIFIRVGIWPCLYYILGGCNPLHSIDVGGWRYWQTMLPGQTTIPTMPMESNTKAQQDWHGLTYTYDMTWYNMIQ